MKITLFALFGLFIVNLTASAQMAVNDAAVQQQLYLNACAELNALETNRKWLDAILQQDFQNGLLINDVKSQTVLANTKLDEIKDKIGDPKLMNTGVSETPNAKLEDNQTLADFRQNANKESKELDSDKLYGPDAVATLKYDVAEQAYINFEKLLVENEEIRKQLISRRDNLIIAMNNAKSLAEVQKLNASLIAVNGKLQTIQEQEQNALMKLLAQQIRNDQKQKRVEIGETDEDIKTYLTSSKRTKPTWWK